VVFRKLFSEALDPVYNKMPPYHPNFGRIAITLPMHPKHFSNLTILPYLSC